MAGTYKYTNSEGIVVITDDYESIPKDFRKSVTVIKDDNLVSGWQKDKSVSGFKHKESAVEFEQKQFKKEKESLYNGIITFSETKGNENILIVIALSFFSFFLECC